MTVRKPIAIDDLPDSGTVTAIEPIASDPNLRRIRVDGRSAARLSAEQVEMLGLVEGAAWDAEVARAVATACNQSVARRLALRVLGSRALSAGELAGRLTKKGFQRELAEDVVAQLAQDDWLNDETYAESVVRELLRTKPAGRRLLLQTLRKRLIDADLAERIVGSALEGVDQADSAEQFARKRLGTMHNVDGTTAARRIAAALTRRGFDTGVITTTLERLDLLSASGREAFDGDAP